MDVHQLESLVAVMDSPTMTKAAEKMHLSTAAVSLQLQALAAELDAELFVRCGRKLGPTPTGWRLAEQAHSVVAQLAAQRRALTEAVAAFLRKSLPIRQQARRLSRSSGLVHPFKVAVARALGAQLLPASRDF